MNLELQKYYQVLGLQSTSNILEVRKNFLSLSKTYHPDSQTGNIKKYYEITEAYDKISASHNKEVLQEEASSSFEKEPQRRSFYQLRQKRENAKLKAEGKTNQTELEEYYEPLGTVSKKENFYRSQANLLTYTVQLDWMELLRSWVEETPYKKLFNYFYEEKCTCEEVCFFCKGNSLFEGECKKCNNTGLINYCEDCNGTGTKKKRDSCELVLEPGIEPPPMVRVLKKGNISYSDNELREPLLIRLYFDMKNLKKTNETFIFKKAVTLDELLDETELRFEITRKKGILIKTINLKKLPYKADISSFFEKTHLSSKKLKCYLYLYLKLN